MLLTSNKLQSLKPQAELNFTAHYEIVSNGSKTF